MTDTLDHTETRRDRLLKQMATGFRPNFMDMTTLCLCISMTPNTVDSLVSEGLLPPPRKVKGKLMWKWSEVDEMLTAGGRSPDAEAERIRNGTRKASEARARH